MAERHVVVIGAGVGGLSAALDLAAAGDAVTVVERHAAPGGKMRQVRVGEADIDSGPTVFTMRWVFEELFAAAGARFSDTVGLSRADVLARHSWLDGSRLDLHADLDRSVDAIGELAGPREAKAYRAFARRSRRVFETLDDSFMRREKRGPVGLTLAMGLTGLPRLIAIRPFTTLWRELGRVFRDPRLRQLFGRYATYCGSSPFRAPATLMLIAHAERAGVWIVDGGMHRLATALAETARGQGAVLRFETEARRIVADGDRVSGVELADGETLAADAVVYNGDVAALTQGLLGPAATRATAKRGGEARSLSALTWSAVSRVDGFPLSHHTVFFGDDYEDEFASIFSRGEVTARPTVYVCAQDRGPAAAADRTGGERLFLLVNAPPRRFATTEAEALRQRVLAHLEGHGLQLADGLAGGVATTPDDYDLMFPGSGGAIYGWPTHGWSGSFRRPGSRARLRGLYLAGGTVHPGPGVPMTALSGRIAAAAVRRDRSREG